MRKQAEVPGERCPVRTAIAVLSGRWKPLIVYYLRGEKKRFSELHRLIPEATRQVLTQQLRQLEEDQIVVRTVYPVVPPKVEYALTPLGSELHAVLDVLERWGESVLAHQGGAVPLPEEGLTSAGDWSQERRNRSFSGSE